MPGQPAAASNQVIPLPAPTAPAVRVPVAAVQPSPRELDADRLRMLLPPEHHVAVTRVYANTTPGTRIVSDPLYQRFPPNSGSN